jgi:hypothetical protein
MKAHLKIVNLTVRTAISASLAASGVVHAYLYMHGYRDIPAVGPAWMQLVAAIGAAGSLVAPCRVPPASSASPKPVGSHHHTLRSPWSPKC